MIKNGYSYTEIRKATLSRLSFLLNLQIEYAKKEEEFLKETQENED